jgi:hypothetical protein
MGNLRGIPARCALIFLGIVSGLLANPPTLEVEVYNLAGKVPILEVRQTLERILAASSIQLRWTLKDPDSPEGQMIVLAGNLRSPEHAGLAACAAKRSISLRIAAHAPPDNDSRELGFSLPFAPAGVNAVVYFDRVLATCIQTGVPLPVLLAHAIAHEIGHVLLRTENHASRDLMAETWRQTEFTMMRQRGLPFKPTQSAQIRGNLAGKQCPPDSGRRGSAQR